MITNTNPYVGLRPFEMDESILFFGRSEQTLEMLQRLHRHHFVSVVGSSGCGKSSLLRAGLIPALKAGYLVEDSDHWFIAIMKPGQNPLYNLAESLLKQINADPTERSISELVQKINEEGADVIIDLLIPFRNEKKLNFFLLVDQFEELFRFAMDQKDAARKDEAIDFVNIILELSTQRTLPFYVVLTMRSDFLGDCAQFYGLPEAMNKSQYLVPKLNRMELKMVIEGPAKLYGGKFNPALTSKLINELGKVKDELPLLQHTLMRLWDFENNENKSNEIDLVDYGKIGGIEKALSKHAEEALTNLNETDQDIAKKMFQSLTAIDENGRKIRRPVLLSQLKELTGASEEKLLGIIDLFIKDRRSFLILNKIAGNDKLIDISHESLIRQWDTLSKWVDEEGESAAIYLRLAEAAKLNQQNKKDLLSGSELQIALDWFNNFNPTPVWANRYKPGFEEAIQYLRNGEMEKVRMMNYETERRRKQKRMAALVIMLLAICTIGAGIFSVVLKRKTNELKNKTGDLEVSSKNLDNTLKVVQSEKANSDRLAEEAEKQRKIADSLASSYLKALVQTEVADTRTKQAVQYAQKLKILKEEADDAKNKAQSSEAFAKEEKRKADIATNAALLEKQQVEKKSKQLESAYDSIETILYATNDINLKTKLDELRSTLKQEDKSAAHQDKEPIIMDTASVVIDTSTSSTFILISVEHLKEIAGISTPLMPGLAEWINKTCPTYGIKTPQELAHFLAQICYESDRFRTTREYASGKAYEGRKDLGNVNPGDGVKYKGRGLFQITGRANYLQLGIKKVNLELFINNPELLEQPEYAVWEACEYWKSRGLIEISNRPDTAILKKKYRGGNIVDVSPIEYISITINGGFNGMAERKKFYEAAKKALGITQ